MTGKFIVVEGVDGVGKSTLVEGLAKTLSARNHPVVTTHELGGSPRAEEIRRIILSDEGAELSPAEQFALIHEGRIDHIKNVIKPALEQGQIVISDRFELSSWVYQVWPDRTSMESVFQQAAKEVAEALGAFSPQYLVLQLDSQTTLERLRLRSELNHFDTLMESEIKDRAKAYDVAMRQVQGVIVRIDATAPASTVLDVALSKIIKINFI